MSNTEAIKRVHWLPQDTRLQYLQQQFPGQRLALLWDGAMYHRSAEIKQFLATVNQDLPPAK